MTRYVIIGLPGSGKSTLATQLGQMLQLPVHHLDCYQFQGNRKQEQEAFVAIQTRLMDPSAWIIEGCAINTLEIRYARADVVLYLRLSRWLCLWRLCKRWLLHVIQMSPPEAAAHGGLKRIPFELLRYMWSFYRRKAAKIERLKATYPHVSFVCFRTSVQVKHYLEEVGAR